MRTLRGLIRGCSASLLALLAAASARAQLFVAASDADPPAVEHAELAYAIGDGSPVTWLSLRAERGPIAIVVALPAGARVRSGLDAWLSALEASASLSVLPPSASARCIDGADFARVVWPRERGTAPTELVLESADDVPTALAELGLSAPEPLPEAESYVVWAFPRAERARTTRTLRVEGAALALAAGWRFPVLVNALTRGSRAYPDETAPSELEVVFTRGERPRTDYAEQLRAWLDRGRAPILEMRARGPLFDWSIYEDALSTAPLVQSYAERAESELGGGDFKACAAELAAFRDERAPDTGACGEALDATLAFTATGPELATLQRFALASAAGVDASAFFSGGYVASPLLRAASVDGEGCETAPLPPRVREPVGGPSSGSTDPPVTEEIVVVEPDDYEDDVEVGCWGDTRTSTGYYEDEGSDDDSVDCSSDTSSTSESDEVDCSSDTSSSSDDSTETDCSSDSSSSSDDSGCSSDTSSPDDEDTGYDGETCTGSAAPQATRTGAQRASLERSSRRKPKKMKTSLWSVGFAALALPIRRRKRSAARAG